MNPQTLKEYVVVQNDAHVDIWPTSQYNKHVEDRAKNPDLYREYKILATFSKDSPYQGSAGVWRSAAKPPGITQWYVVKCEQRRFASLIYVDSKITLERVAKDIDVEIDLLEWLDESAASPAGDGWVSEKPEFESECRFVTATWIKENWDYILWEIKKIDGEFGWYYGLCDSYGDEWGPIDDLKADKYLILPSPPNKSV